MSTKALPRRTFMKQVASASDALALVFDTIIVFLVPAGWLWMTVDLIVG